MKVLFRHLSWVFSALWIFRLLQANDTGEEIGIILFTGVVTFSSYYFAAMSKAGWLPYLAAATQVGVLIDSFLVGFRWIEQDMIATMLLCAGLSIVLCIFALCVRGGRAYMVSMGHPYAMADSDPDDP